MTAEQIDVLIELADQERDRLLKVIREFRFDTLLGRNLRIDAELRIRDLSDTIGALKGMLK